MISPPTMPVGVDHYLADTAHLTLEQQAVHFCLQIYAWRSPGCRLPDDDAKLAQMLGVTGKRWSSLKPAVMALWILAVGVWRQDRLSEQHAEASKRRRKARAAVKSRLDPMPPSAGPAELLRIVHDYAARTGGRRQ